MARGRLSLVIVLLLVASRFLNATHDDSNYDSKETDNWNWKQGESLFCATFMEPGRKNVTLKLKEYLGSWRDTVTVDPGECAPQHTDVLKVQAMRGNRTKLYLKMTLGDCDATCLITKELSYPPTLLVFIDDEKKKKMCHKADLPPFNADTKDGHVLCTNGRILNRTPPTEPPLSSTESFVAPEGDATNLTNPPAPVMSKPSSTVLEIVLVLELVATCVMAVLVVWVMRSGGKKSGVTPATTDVRRNSHQGEVYICENDLYEPFTGPAAAQATGGQT